MKPHILVSAVLALLLLLPATARADGLITVGRYTNGSDISLNISTYQEGGDKVGLLSMLLPPHKGSMAFNKNTWPSFVALWHKAESTQSGSFQFIGSYKEIGTTYPSLLTVAAGPGVQFTINDPGNPTEQNYPAETYSFILSPNDFARFDADVAKVTDFLNSN